MTFQPPEPECRLTLRGRILAALQKDHENAATVQTIIDNLPPTGPPNIPPDPSRVRATLHTMVSRGLVQFHEDREVHPTPARLYWRSRSPTPERDPDDPVKFKSRFHEDLRAGRKTATTRTHCLGRPGARVRTTVGAATLGRAAWVPLALVRDLWLREEGVGSPEEFMAVWAECYGWWEPRRLVWFHTFKLDGGGR